MKPGDIFARPEGLDLAQRRVRVRQRQGQHRVEAAAAFGQRFFGQPPIVGPAQLDLHFGIGMQPDGEHQGREQAGIVDAQRVHPAMAELDVAQLARGGLFG